MAQRELLDAIQSLQAELAEVDRIDPKTQAALGKVTDELQRLLDPADATTTDDVETSSEGVRGYLMEFEADHPRLAETLGRLADGLANMGI